METFEEQLDQLLDNYYNARHITKDDERSLAAGVLEMAKAQEAIVQANQLAIDKAVVEARLDEALKYPQPLYGKGMHDGRKDELLEIGLLAHKFEGEDYHCREIADAIDERLAALQLNNLKESK